MSTKSSQLKLTLLDGVTGPARRVGGALAALNRQTSQTMAPFRGIGGQLLAFGGAYLGVTKGISSTVGAAIEFESAFADVKKVVNASDEQFQNMSRTIKSMSRELPMTSVEIAQLFAAAGESDIPVEELKSFAEMASRVGIAFDMSAGEAGESLAKLKSQLGLSVGETGDMADAINHLSNNMASKAKDITAYMLRVGKLAEMGGLAKEQVAAIGSAMISAGAEAETAGTAMQNVVKAMTRGASAKKSQRDAAKALGLDLPALAKQMQKDAPGAIKKVLGAIAKAPKDRHISLISDFFGDEAKAFAPLIGNIGLLDKALDAVANKTNYSGSAFREYVERANTTANALQILRNKVSFFFEDIGAAWLPEIKVAVAEIGGLLDTLGSRASVFDDIKYALKGFTQGLGYDGGIKEVIRDLGDLLFGKEDPSGAADRLGGVFAKFEQYGQSVRQFKKDLDENPIVKFFKDLSPLYVDVLKWSVGFLVVSAAIRKLASALWFLSGASTIVGALKALGGVATALGIGGGGLDKVIGAAGTSAGSIYGKAFGLAAKAAIVAGIALAVGEVLQTFDPKGNLGGITSPVDNWLRDKMGLPPRDSGITPGEIWDGFGNILPDFNPAPSADTDDGGRAVSMDAYLDDFAPKQEQYEGGRHRAGAGVGPQPGEGVVRYARSGLPATIGIGRTLPGIGLLERNLSTLPSEWQQDRPVTLDAGTIGQLLQPTRGVQEVRVTNKEPPQIHLSVTQNITGVSSPQEAADQAASRLGQAVKSAVESADTD